MRFWKWIRRGGGYDKRVFMVNDNTPKVIFEPSLDDCDLIMNELGNAFVELSNNYDFLKKNI